MASGLKGVDVSQHQGSVDWQKVTGAGFDFAIFKSSEGQDFIDPADGSKSDANDRRLERLRARCVDIRQHGLTLGVYHYLRPRPGRTGDVEADWAVKVARKIGWGKPGDMRLVVDVEETGLASPLATHRYVGQFANRVRALTGHRPVIYTFPSFWNALGNRPNFGCPLWIAHFEVTNPSIPQPWQKFAIWQHTSKGQVPGIAGNVDLNQATKLPLISASEPLPAPLPEPVPEPVLSKRERLVARMRHARRAFLATGSNDALRIMLVCKARLGRYDERYHLFFGPPADVTDDVKRFITRAYASGLVPTSTTNGVHAPGSFHGQHRAADIGLRTDLVGTTKGLRRMERFQRAEFNRRANTHPVELIGPINGQVVLSGVPTALAEGQPLEEQHDNHVHGAF